MRAPPCRTRRTRSQDLQGLSCRPPSVGVAVRSESSELALAGWGAATFAALLASYAAFKPVRDALILDGDPDQIAWLFGATFVAVSVASPVWSAVLTRHDRRRVVPMTFHVFAACVVAFALLVHAGVAPIAIGRVFYVWSAVFNLFVVSVFWSLLADLLGTHTARRLYGPIAAGGTVGAFAGPLLTKLLVATIHVPGVLVMSAVLLELAVIGVSQVRRAGERLELGAAHPHPPAPPIEAGGAFTGLAHVARSPFLAAVVGYVLCTAVAATFLYLEQMSIVKSAFADRAARTDLFATLELWTAAATLVVQTVIAGPVIGWLGPGVVLLVLPLAQLVGISTLAFAPSVSALAIIVVVTRTATHGLTRPARELLFTVVSSDDKYRAKNVIDTMAYRLGDFGSSWLFRGLVAAGAGGAAIVAATLPLVAIWLGLATLIGVGFRRRVLATQELP